MFSRKQKNISPKAPMYYFLPEHLVREVTNQGKTHGPRIPLNE